jgi:hypothetical protein
MILVVKWSATDKVRNKELLQRILKQANIEKSTWEEL